MSKATVVPEGYRADPKGRLVPESLITEIDKQRDELVLELAELAKATSNDLAALKRRAFRDIEAFAELAAEKYGAKIGGGKGNLSLFSFDGKFKIQIQVADRQQYDERIRAGEALLLECAAEWGDGLRPEVKALLNITFQTDSSGKVSISRIRDLKNLDIQDEKWKRGIAAINDSLQVVGSKAYVRFFERDEQGEYLPITLDAAAV